MIFLEEGPLHPGPGKGPVLFDAPKRLITAHSPDQVPAALQALSDAHAEGLWVAGYASYELGYVLEPRLSGLMPQGQRHPLMAFGVYDAPGSGQALLSQAEHEADAARLGPLRADWSAARYGQAFEALHGYIGAGDCYQVNLTLPLRGERAGTALGLYGALRRRQPVRHGAFVDLGVGPVVLSRSPELFFRIDADGQIETRPMKGTSPRDPDPLRDANLRDSLAASVKNRAENLMIVDLLRNDISQICQPGSVRVPELFHVESFTTVHQMTSRVTGDLRPDVAISDVLVALFPCGSITGAPKIRAMQIIAELEEAPRGVYCGAIGWFAPDGRAEFNVAIRTLSLFDDQEVVMNVGGGWSMTAPPLLNTRKRCGKPALRICHEPRVWRQPAAAWL